MVINVYVKKRKIILNIQLNFMSGKLEIELIKPPS